MHLRARAEAAGPTSRQRQLRYGMSDLMREALLPSGWGGASWRDYGVDFERAQVEHELGAGVAILQPAAEAVGAGWRATAAPASPASVDDHLEAKSLQDLCNELTATEGLCLDLSRVGVPVSVP
jgi:hypothetical protein